MDRLISERAVIESIEFFQMNPQHFDFVNLIDDIKEIPTSIPLCVYERLLADKPQGEWIEQDGWDGDVYYECSICHEPFILIEGTPTDNLYNFCPNCGAKMGKEQE